MEITNEQLLQLLQEKLEQRPAKSMLKMEISDFTADAYKQGEFIKVSKKDLLGKWSVLFFYPADFTFVCPTELADLQDNYEKFKKIGCEIYSVSMDSHFVHKAWHESSDRINHVDSSPSSSACIARQTAWQNVELSLSIQKVRLLPMK